MKSENITFYTICKYSFGNLDISTDCHSEWILMRYCKEIQLTGRDRDDNTIVTFTWRDGVGRGGGGL